MLKTLSTFATASALAGSLIAADTDVVQAQSLLGMSIVTDDHYIDACTSDGHLTTVYFQSDYSTPLVEGREQIIENQRKLETLEGTIDSTDAVMTQAWQRAIEGKTLNEVIENSQAIYNGVQPAFTAAITGARNEMATLGFQGSIYNPINVTSTATPDPSCTGEKKPGLSAPSV